MGGGRVAVCNRGFGLTGRSGVTIILDELASAWRTEAAAASRGSEPQGRGPHRQACIEPTLMKTRRGFTLIEILVVVAIIALLISIILPAFKEVRRQAKRTVCLSNLDQIHVAIQGYLNNNRDYLPTDVSRLPTTEPTLRSLPDALIKEMGAGAVKKKGAFKNEVFLCPADVITKQTILALPGIRQAGPRYYDSQQSSYEWNDFLSGKKVRNRAKMLIYDGIQETDFFVKDLTLISDYEVWHGPPEQRKTFNALYLNWEPRSDTESKAKTSEKIRRTPTGP